MVYCSSLVWLSRIKKCSLKEVQRGGGGPSTMGILAEGQKLQPTIAVI